jgi:hypothetical protein
MQCVEKLIHLLTVQCVNAHARQKLSQCCAVCLMHTVVDQLFQLHLLQCINAYLHVRVFLGIMYTQYRSLTPFHTARYTTTTAMLQLIHRMSSITNLLSLNYASKLESSYAVCIPLLQCAQQLF